MDKLLEIFKDCYIRDYKGGKEIRTRNFDWSLEKASKVIDTFKLNVEIFEKDSRLNSFAIREKGTN